MSGSWQPIATAHPEPHAKYLVRRADLLFTATPCYGMHTQWWVVMTMSGEAGPVGMLDTDEWMPLRWEKQPTKSMQRDHQRLIEALADDDLL